MPQNLREELSMQVLAKLKSKRSLAQNLFQSQRGIKDLEKEIECGQCHLVEDGSGTVLRVVQLGVLRITRCDGLICVRLARCTDGVWKPAFALPAQKVRNDETP